MKERLLDVVKWGLILIIAGAVFYLVSPKYYFGNDSGRIFSRANTITGKIEVHPKYKHVFKQWPN